MTARNPAVESVRGHRPRLQRKLQTSAGPALYRSRPGAALMCAGNLQVFAILRDAATSHGDAFVLQHLCDLVVGERILWILFVDELSNLALHDQERGFISHWPIHGFGKKVTQFEYSLG